MSTQFNIENPSNKNERTIQPKRFSEEKDIIHTDDGTFLREIRQDSSHPSKICGKNFKCPVCQKVFFKNSLLKKHQVVHSEDRPYNCEQCPKSFKRLRDVKKHQMIHSKITQYKCKECLKGFKRLDYLTKHEKIHNKSASYECEKCSKCFTRPDILKKHRMIHTTVQFNKCEKCGQCFTQLSYLKSHQKVHSGEKPYKCEQCQKSFSQLCNLKQHQMVHIGEKHYTCSKCQEGFIRLIHLKEHLVTQCGKNPLKCKDCQQVFNSRSNLGRHLKKFHSGKEKPASSRKCNLERDSYLVDNNLSSIDDETLSYEKPAISRNASSTQAQKLFCHEDTTRLNSSCDQHSSNLLYSESFTNNEETQNDKSSFKHGNSPNKRIQTPNLSTIEFIGQGYNYDNVSTPENVSFASDQNQQRFQISTEEKKWKCYLCSYDCNNDLELSLHFLSHLEDFENHTGKAND